MITIWLIKIAIITPFAILFFLMIRNIFISDNRKKYVDFVKSDEKKDFRIVYREHPYFEKKYYFIDILKTNWVGKKYWLIEGVEGEYYYIPEYFYTFKEAEEYLKKEYLNTFHKEKERKTYYSKGEEKSIPEFLTECSKKNSKVNFLFEQLKEKKMEEETKKSDESRKAKGKFCTFCGNELNVCPTHKGMILQCPVCLKEHQHDEKKSWDKEVNITTVILNLVMTILSYIFKNNKKAEKIVEVISKGQQNDK
jgi:hypothetical protein